MQSIQQYTFPKKSILRPMVFTETTRQRDSWKKKYFQSAIYERYYLK